MNFKEYIELSEAGLNIDVLKGFSNGGIKATFGSLPLTKVHKVLSVKDGSKFPSRQVQFAIADVFRREKDAIYGVYVKFNNVPVVLMSNYDSPTDADPNNKTFDVETSAQFGGKSFYIDRSASEKITELLADIAKTNYTGQQLEISIVDVH